MTERHGHRDGSPNAPRPAGLHGITIPVILSLPSEGPAVRTDADHTREFAPVIRQPARELCVGRARRGARRRDNEESSAEGKIGRWEGKKEKKKGKERREDPRGGERKRRGRAEKPRPERAERQNNIYTGMARRSATARLPTTCRRAPRTSVLSPLEPEESIDRNTQRARYRSLRFRVAPLGPREREREKESEERGKKMYPACRAQRSV